MHPPRTAHTSLEADTAVPAGQPSSNSSAVPKPTLCTSANQGGAMDGSAKPESQVQSSTAPAPAPRADGGGSGTVLPLGVVVNAPTYPPAGGFIVPRLFAAHADIDLHTPQRTEPGQDITLQSGAQKRKRLEVKPEVGQHKVPLTAAGMLPPPQPLAANPVAGKSTLPPAPNTNAVPGGQAQRSRPPEPPGMCPPPPPTIGGGRLSDEPRPRFQGSAVFGGVRGSSGADRRPEKGSFIGRTGGAHDQAPGFLPRTWIEDGDGMSRCAPRHCIGDRENLVDNVFQLAAVPCHFRISLVCHRFSSFGCQVQLGGLCTRGYLRRLAPPFWRTR